MNARAIVMKKKNVILKRQKLQNFSETNLPVGVHRNPPGHEHGLRRTAQNAPQI